VPLALLELECAAVEVEAPFKLRLDCCDSLRRGYGGRIIHDGRRFCKALCQKGSGELVESVFEVQFPDCEVRAVLQQVFEHRPDAEGEFLR
jgi:hypothetical protein